MEKIGRFSVLVSPCDAKGSWDGANQKFRNDKSKKELISFVDSTVNETVAEFHLIKSRHYKEVRRTQLSVLQKAKVLLGKNLHKTNKEISLELNPFNF